MSICLLCTILVAVANRNPRNVKIDSIFKINHELEGFIMPMYEYKNNANLFQLRYFRL